MISPLVRTEQHGTVLVVWLDEPERKNPLSDPMIEALSAALRAPAHVLRLGKMAVRSGRADDYRVGLESGSLLRSLLFSSAAFHDGVTAFFDPPRT